MGTEEHLITGCWFITLLYINICLQGGTCGKRDSRKWWKVFECHNAKVAKGCAIQESLMEWKDMPGVMSFKTGSAVLLSRMILGWGLCVLSLQSIAEWHCVPYRLWQPSGNTDVHRNSSGYCHREFITRKWEPMLRQTTRYNAAEDVRKGAVCVPLLTQQGWWECSFDPACGFTDNVPRTGSSKDEGQREEWVQEPCAAEGAQFEGLLNGALWSQSERACRRQL